MHYKYISLWVIDMCQHMVGEIVHGFFFPFYLFLFLVEYCGVFGCWVLWNNYVDTLILCLNAKGDM